MLTLCGIFEQEDKPLGVDGLFAHGLFVHDWFEHD